MKTKITIVILSIVFIFTELNAEIIYTDINPDKILSGTTEQPFVSYYVDLNNDGQNDFEFRHTNLDGAWLQVEVYCVREQNSNILASNGNVPKNLNQGEEISSASSKWVNTQMGSVNSALFLTGAWPGAGPQYLAVRFLIDGVYHYGWIRLSVAGDETSQTLMDYAYETEAEQRILAGDMGTTDVDDQINTGSIAYENGFLYFRNIGKEKNNVDIYNLLGKNIMSYAFSGDFGQLNVDYLQKGLYIVLITNVEKKYIYKLIR